MGRKDRLNRRQFLQRGVVLGAGAWLAPPLVQRAAAASKDRMVVYQGVGLDSLHPYGYSGGGINGIWLHMIEPLIVMDYARKDYVGVLAESWEFQGRKWVFRLKKNIRF